MNYATGLIGMWLISDALFSLLVHTKPPLSEHQTLLRDHSIRLARLACGVALVIMGAIGT